MKIARNVAFLILAYVGTVIAFEAFLGLVQPRLKADSSDARDVTIVITTTGADGSTQDRVVTPLDDDGRLYVSANHWPRSWYRRALENPQVRVTRDGETRDHRAVPVPASDEEHGRLQREHPHPAWFRFLTGFPPRRFLQLEPR